jgi:hypothetical protein
MKYRRHAPGTEQADGVEASRPEWFAAFLADRGTRKPSAHTIKAYRQDFDAIATLIAGSALALTRTAPLAPSCTDYGTPSLPNGQL